MSFRFPRRWRERDSGPNPLSEALERRRASGLPLFDLTLSNPTQCGLSFPEDWQELLGGRAVRSYDPDPRGNAAAREAVAAYYRERDDDVVDPTDLFLTAGTSEAYSHLFKLLCESGDEALIPRPSYPLLETLADLEGIVLKPFPLRRGTGNSETGTPWRLDRAALEAALTPRARLVFIVQPNNPTGSVLDAGDAAWLLALAERHDLALIVDEVFADYHHAERGHTEARAAQLGSNGPLVFTLNGLSKLLGLPQLKLAWIRVQGNATDKARAREHLEWICDAYLSVGTAPQIACAELLRRRAEFQGPLRRRLAENLGLLRAAAARDPRLRPLWPQGGWCVPVRCAGLTEAGSDDEAFAIDLLEAHGVQVQPGYFFDFEEDDVILLSLLPEPEIFREGLARLSRALA